MDLKQFAAVIAAGWLLAWASSAASTPAGGAGVAPVSVREGATVFTLTNGFIAARINKGSGVLESLKYQGLELLAQGRGGAEGGYWSSVGRGRPGGGHGAAVRCDPATNGGARGEISCQLFNDSQSPTAPVDADYRYALGRGEPWIYVYAVLTHQPGYPAFGVGEARYCLKLNPDVFDYLTVDASRRRLMPSGYDWDHGAALNLKEARRMTTGVHKGEAEHKYDYSAVLAETAAYGWSSTRHHVGLWLINPSLEYVGGGPTKAELTGHLDVNPGGLPTLLNMWVGSHYGGTTIAVATNELWSKVVGPFALYCNGGGSGADASHRQESATERPEEDRSGLSPARTDARQKTLWQDALARAGIEAGQWPYAWVADPNYPPERGRGGVEGRIVVRDWLAPQLTISNLWVGLAAPDYYPPRLGFGFGFRRLRTNSPFAGSFPTNFAGRGPGRGGFPPEVDWQRDAKFYQYWVRGDDRGGFAIRHVRPGTYTLHAIADGVLGELSLTNIAVVAGRSESLGQLTWAPRRFGRTVWELGLADRTAREYRHGDRYWQWGLYFDYAKEFPEDVNFVIGRSDWRRDWNYVQPPHFETRNLGITGEEEEASEEAGSRTRAGSRNVRSTTWAITFLLPEAGVGEATLRLAFCGTHGGCNVEAFVNGKSIGETGPLPSTSAMQRDGIRAYWVEKDLGFDGAWLGRGTNVIKLLSHADSWSQGVMYDYLRLELGPGAP